MTPQYIEISRKLVEQDWWVCRAGTVFCGVDSNGKVSYGFISKEQWRQVVNGFVTFIPDLTNMATAGAILGFIQEWNLVIERFSDGWCIEEIHGRTKEEGGEWYDEHLGVAAAMAALSLRA